MKYLWVWIFLFCFPGHAEPQNSTADDQASCNASFHQNCVPDQTSTTSSSGFAAPLGVLGSSGLEGALVVLIVAGGVARRLHRHAARGS